MNNLFIISLTIIGGVIGFIIGVTLGFSININSPYILYGLAVIFAAIGGFTLSKIAPAINNQDANTQKTLTILFTIIAVILFLLLIVTITMLNIRFNI